MVIKDVRVTRSKQLTILSARCKIRKIGWDNVFFSLDSKKHTYIYQDASPFAAALLIPAMKMGEDLIIHGSISKQLYVGMQAIMDEVLQWDIGLKPIQIKADTITEDSHKPTKTATFFSGGVDSFYTYLKHRKDSVKSDRIDSFIFINNSFDIDPKNTELWQHTVKNIKAIAKAEKIELLIVRSNINTHELLAPIVSWDYIHGGCLAATGLFLRGAYHRIYIPSTHSVAEQIPWGSNLALDNYWGTEKLSFVHDGSETTRLNKVVSQIADSPVALKHLRVCYKNKIGLYNCGKCDKCLRTMVNLYIAGVLEKSKTFPHNLDIERIATTPTITGKDRQIFHNENLSALKKKSLNPALQKAIQASIDLTLTMKTDQSNKIRDRVAFYDHSYTRGYVYSIYTGMFGKRFS